MTSDVPPDGDPFHVETHESNDMKKIFPTLAATLVFGLFLVADTTAQEPPSSTHSSIVLDLSTSSRLGVSHLLMPFCPGRDGGGPSLDLITIVDDTGGGNGSVIRWVFELQDLGDDHLMLRPLQGCASGGQIENDCGVWNVTVAVDAPSQPSGLLSLETDQAGGGGIARGEVLIPLEIRFEEVGTGTVTTLDHSFVYYIRAPWATTPGSDAWQSSTPFDIDSDCDGAPDGQAPATTGAPALGWVEDPTSGEPVRGQVCGAAEDLGGWLCGSPAAEDPADSGGTGGDGDPGEGGMS